MAALNGHNDVVDVLIKYGASLNAINKVSVFIIKHVVIIIHDCILYVMLLLIHVIM